MLFPHLTRPFNQSLVLLSLCVWSLVACGPKFNETEVREYRLSVVNGTPAQHEGFRKVVAEYNQLAGFEALRYTDRAEEANSAIILTRGLTARDGKVGWGQWLSETEQDRKLVFAPGENVSRTTVYTMRLEFDETYVAERLAATETETAKRYDLKKLFAHEVGHGLMLGHDPNPAHVMYFDITGTKDFNGYYTYVRRYFGR